MSLFDKEYDEVFGSDANLLSNLLSGLGFSYWDAVMTLWWNETMTLLWDTPMDNEAQTP